MNVNSDDVAWERYEGPEWYQPSSVPTSLETMARAATQDEAWDAYNAILFAIGNNHKGTLYPAAVGAVPLIVEMTRSDRPWARFAAVQVLIECATSFHPEPGFETTRLPDGALCEVGAEMRTRLEAARPQLSHQLGGEPHSDVRAALSELLENLPRRTNEQ